MTEPTTSALTTIREWGVVGSVLVLSLIALIWIVKKVLSDKDDTIKILRGNIEKMRLEQKEADKNMLVFLNTQEKLVDTVEKNHLRSEANLEKILTSISLCKDVFNSLPK